MRRARLAFGWIFAVLALGCGNDPATPRSGPVEANSARGASSLVSSGEARTASASGSSSAPSAKAPSSAGAVTSCANLAAEIQRTEARWAGAALACTTDAECACYGGPVCPNALVKACPAPVGSAAAAELAPLQRAWSDARCGGYAWSPYRCDAACIQGRCGTKTSP
ncbi:MAG: hypothetical protein U0414_13645 [Polyangiaceae bacterium]|mgnify:CR=1 FL=1